MTARMMAETGVVRRLQSWGGTMAYGRCVDARISVAVGMAIVLTALAGCSSAASTRYNNPDRDVVGFRQVPLLPKDLGSLQRMAVGRKQWKTDLSLDEAARRIVDGARACHEREYRPAANPAFQSGAPGEQRPDAGESVGRPSPLAERTPRET
jgi:hypothetical protein